MTDTEYLNNVTSASWEGFSTSASYPSATPPYVALFEGDPALPLGAYYRSVHATADAIPVGSSLDGVSFTFSIKTKSFNNQLELRLWPENEPLKTDAYGGHQPPDLNAFLGRFYFRTDNFERGPVSPSGGTLPTPNGTLGFDDRDQFDTFTVELSEVNETTLEVRVYDNANNLLQTYTTGMPWFQTPPGGFVYEPNPGEVYEYGYPFAEGPYPADHFEPGSPPGYYGMEFYFNQPIPPSYPRYQGYLIGPLTEVSVAPPYDPALGQPGLKIGFNLSMLGQDWNHYVLEPNPGERYVLGTSAAFYAANHFEAGSPEGYYSVQYYAGSILPSEYIDAGYSGNQYFRWVGPLTVEPVLAFEDVEVSVSAFTLTLPSTVPAQPTDVTLVDVTTTDFTLTWVAPDDGGSPITDYVIEYRAAGDTAFTTVEDGTNVTTSIVLDGLATATTYEVRVAAVNDAGAGDFSPTVSFTTLFVDEDNVQIAFPPGGAVTPAGTTVIEPDYLNGNELAALYGITPGSITLIERVSPVMPDPRDVPVTMGRPRSNTFTPTSVTRAPLGWVRVVVDGEDVTFLRGVPAQIVDVRETEPFGWQSATVRFPQITGFEDDRYGHAQKFFDGARVAITLRDTAGNKLEDLFHGVIVERAYAVEEGSPPGLDVTCLGLLYTADLCLAKPELMVETQDLADVLQQRLNQVPSRRFLALEPSGPTGIENRDRGAWQPLLTGFVQDALADAITDDGEQQWTILMDGRRPVLQLKDRTTIHHAVTLGTPGVSVSLTKDVTQSTTTVYGYGVDSTNEAWANLKLPDYDSTAIAWPLADENSVLASGATGEGVTTLQTRLRRAGYGVKVTGTYDSATTSAVRAYQGSNGLDATGQVNAATWTSIFAAAMNPGLDTAYYAPLATIGRVEKYRYNADGAITEVNPNYDDTRLRVERWHAYADGLSKQQAARAARAQVLRGRNPGWFGTITLRVDPETTTRWGIHAGQNILLRGFMGDSRVYDNNPDANPSARQVLFHIAEVVRDGEGTVTLTVDTEARDLPTLDAIFVRDKEATNPARRPGAKRRAETPPDTPVIDGELKGWIDGMPVAAGTWSVIKVPIGVEGTIVGFDLVADTATPFAVAFFTAPVTQATLNGITTTPLSWVNEDQGIRPFPGTESTADDLEALGWLDTVGGPGEAAGYWPGSQADGGSITGKHKDRAISIPFVSAAPPWVYVAVWSVDAATYTGRIYLEPQR